MVEFGSGPVKENIDNTVFIIPGIIIVFLVGKNIALHMTHDDLDCRVTREWSDVHSEIYVD